MKNRTFFIIITVVFFLSSCAVTRKNKHANKKYTVEMQQKLANYPDIIGFERRAIFVSETKNRAEEKDMKIEIIPGRDLVVDCNSYGISGKMLKKKFDTGYTYYLFNSNGEILSTKMACPDSTRKSKFITGETIMVDYDSQKPIVVYTAKSFDVRYSLWKAGDIKTSSVLEDEANSDAVKYLSKFNEKDDYVRKIIMLEKLSPEKEFNMKVEIIPGANAYVDCNQHTLLGNLNKEFLKGYGFSYFVFDSNGEIISTKMNCPESSKTKTYVKGATKIIPYNSSVPILVYVPKGIELKYRIWTSNGKIY